MFKKTNSSKEYNRKEKNEQCSCNDNNESYKIIENYRSILDRKQQLISSWKIFDKNGKVNFTRGTQFRKDTDAFVIRLNHICLINPWYKYIDVNKHLLSILKQNQNDKVFEIVLLEYNCLTKSHDYELAIIECPCLKQWKTYCTYCRLILVATEQSNILLPTQWLNNVNQQTIISFPLDFFNDEINTNDSFYSRSGPYQYQRTVQIQVESEQVRHAITDLLTTKKLTNVSQQLLVSQIVDEDVDNSLSETKSITLLQDEDITQRSSHSSISLHFLSQQHFSKNISTISDLQFSSQSQDTIESNEDLLYDKSTFEILTKYITRETQTKLFAILLPQSSLNEMKQAKIKARTSMNITRICQVNTLPYLIKTNEKSQTNVQHPIEDIWRVQQIDHSSTTSFPYNETQSIKDLLSEEKGFSNKPSTPTKQQVLDDCKYYEQGVTVPIIEFEGGELLDHFEEEKINLASTNREILPTKEEQSEEFILTSSPLKCVNTYNGVVLDEPSASMISPFFDDDTTSTWISSNQQNKKYCRPSPSTNLEHVDTQLMIYNKFSSNSNIHIIKCSNNNNNSNSEQLTSDHSLSDNCQTLKLFRLKTHYYRFISQKRRRHRNKKHIYAFLQRLHCRKKPNIIQLSSSKQHFPSYSSSFIITTNHYNPVENHLLTTQTNTIKQNTSFNKQQQSVINLQLNNSDSICQYKAHDHTIVARASKNSKACKQLQILLNNHHTSLEQLIDSQLTLTCNNNCRSVCILIDDHKQSKQYRSSFLHYIYTTLTNTLKKIFYNKSIQLTCMNFVFFNNSLYDIINMQRLRLIDTGKEVLLLPSCEITLKTSDDINIAMNRLSKKMLFAHQIFIINFYREQSSLSGSFLFIQLAPICSIRPTSLLTNLNSTTYFVLNLIRQFNNGQFFNYNTTKRYLLNDCSLNRLLKSYLFSPEQTMTVLTVKSKLQ